MKSFLKKVVNSVLGFFGKEVRATHAPIQSLAKGLKMLAPLLSAHTIIDIGVADGTPELYDAFSGKDFLLIEANPLYRSKVQHIASRLGASVEMTFCGEETSTARLHLAGQSSSKYPVNETGSIVDVSVKALDDIVAAHKLTGPLVLKIDVEGAELEVLKGADQTLKSVIALIIELPLLGIRPRSPSFEDTFAFIASQGFHLFNVCEGGGIQENGRLGQADFIFLRQDSITLHESSISDQRYA